MLCGTDPGPRKRKKPARFGEFFEDDDDFGSENQPPTNIPRLAKESLLAKAQNATPQPAAKLSLGKSPLGQTAAETSPNEESTPAPLGESNLNRLNIQKAEQLDVPTSAPAKLTQATQTPSAVVKSEELENFTWKRPDSVGLPGQLKSLVLVNFMCHEHLRMTFGPHVNFISGQNGSGKSAVLQAIQQVLGVRARDTGRATSQTSFIKTGCPDATITITLWNQGPEAFQPEVFGPEIIIERRIGKTATFSIKSSRGKKIGHKREDLNAILDYLNINAANPIAVMTQDTTRSFMDGGAGKRDRQKYEIYMEATSLARIDDANAKSSVELAEMHAEVQSEKEKHNLLMKQQKGLEDSLEALKQVDAAKAEEIELQQALSWASVLSTRADIEHYSRHIDERGPQLREQAQADSEAAKAKLAELEAKAASVEICADSFSTEMEELSLTSHRMQEAISRAKTGQRKAGNALREAKKSAEKASQDLQALIDSSMVADEEVMAKMNASKITHEEEMAKTKAELEAIQSEKTSNDALLHKNHMLHVELHKRKDDAERAVAEHKKHVAAKHKEVKKAEEAVLSSLGSFGEKVESICALLRANRTKFHKAPIGPIGSLLVLKDPRYGKIMENCLSQYYKYFIVHDHDDYKILKQMCKAKNLRVPLCVIMSHELPLHNTEADLPPSGVLTLYDIVDCSDEKHKPTVLNFLIDSARIQHQAISSSGHKESMKRTADLRNVDSVWKADGWKMTKTRNALTTCPPFKMFFTIGDADTKKRNLQGLKSELAVLKDQCKDATERFDEVVGEFNRNRLTVYPRLKDKCLELESARVKLQQTQEELTERIQETNKEIAVLIGSNDKNSTIAADIESLTVEVNELESQVAEKVLAANEANEHFDKVTKDQEETRERMKEIEEQHQTDIDNSNKRGVALQQATEEVANLEQYCEQLEAKLGALAEAKGASETTLALNLEQAAQICPEEEGLAVLEKIKAELKAKDVADETLGAKELPLFLNKKLERLQARIRTQENQAGGRRTDVEDRLRRMRRKTQASQRSLDGLGSTYTLLRAGYDWRKDQFDRMDKMVEETVNLRFSKYLNKKGHNGSIKVIRQKNDRNQEDNALEIKVMIDGCSSQGKVKDLKQLSGGERSFTTVAFSLALGEYTNCPFRAMDEFDVFMDAVNRQVSLDSLLSNAVDHKELQFLFLTPLDISAVNGTMKTMRERNIDIKDDFVKIVCMQSARPTPITID